MNIKEKLKELIQKSIKLNNIEYSEDLIISIPKNKAFGDYSTNIALVLSDQLKENPIDLATKIISKVSDPIIEHINFVKPGFINFTLNKSYLTDNIHQIIQEKENYGRSQIGNNQKVNIEFVSANPTGTLHIGHGRAVYGDNLARIMAFNGYQVTKEYYINDAGNQMNLLGESIKLRYLELIGEKITLPENSYHGIEIIETARHIYNQYGNTKKEESISYFKDIGLEIMLKDIKKDLDKYRINFDVFTNEQSLYDSNEIETTLSKLMNSGKCYTKEGALWLKTTEYNDQKDRVLIKQDGLYTYLLPDIAYHINKYKRGYDQIIDLFGADHHGYIKRIKAGIDILGYDSQKLDIKILQMVRLIKDGEELKLSKRTGKTITLNELIEEVGINATRYFFSSKSIETPMEFNINLAKKNNNENPVYYIEYAYARICTILKSCRHYQKEIPIKLNTINYETSKELMQKLYEFQEIVVISAKKKEPHLIANYIYELATLFHAYYSKEKIISDNEEYTKDRLTLISSVKIVLQNALNLIGIIPREEM